jgi:hypothetical protein
LEVSVLLENGEREVAGPSFVLCEFSVGGLAGLFGLVSGFGQEEGAGGHAEGSFEGKCDVCAQSDSAGHDLADVLFGQLGAGGEIGLGHASGVEFGAQQCARCDSPLGLELDVGRAGLI